MTGHAAFFGWLKTPGQPWRLVAEGTSEAECWDRLLQAEADGPHAQRVVLARGVLPVRRRRAAVAGSVTEKGGPK